MPHLLEEASTGRASCRGCKQKLPKSELRFGQRIPNPYGDGEATAWFHLRCAALRVPADLSETLESHGTEIPGRPELEALAAETLAHPRLSHLGGIERASSGRSKCRQCSELIEKDGLRVAVGEVEDGIVQPFGFIHLTCATKYCRTDRAAARLRASATGLAEDDAEELDRLFPSE